MSECAVPLLYERKGFVARKLTHDAAHDAGVTASVREYLYPPLCESVSE